MTAHVQPNTTCFVHHMDLGTYIVTQAPAVQRCGPRLVSCRHEFSVLFDFSIALALVYNCLDLCAPRFP